MEINTSGMGALVISVHKKYGVVLFEGVVQLTLFPETRIKPFKQYRSAAQFKGAAQIK